MPQPEKSLMFRLAIASMFAFRDGGYHQITAFVLIPPASHIVAISS